MTNNPRRLPVAGSAAPRSTLELLDNVPESLLRRLKQNSGRFATEAVAAMQERLPFFAELEASQRASVHLVVQAAVVNFAEWMRNPHSNVGFTVQAFELVPQDLTRRIALRQTVDMVRLTMEFFEEVVPMLAGEEHATALTTGILRYSRDLAFTAASAYADAAEARGAWDSRMEANLVDAVRRQAGKRVAAMIVLSDGANNTGIPVVLKYPKSRVAQGMAELARAALADRPRSDKFPLPTYGVAAAPWR